MDANERELLFEQAVTEYRRGRFAAGRKMLTELIQDGSRDPAHLSYYGLMLALTGEREGCIAHCEEAVSKDGRRASLLYLNLARALHVSGRRREAIEALNRGLLVHPADRQLRVALQHLVPRARPVLASLDRRHGLNRFLGLVRSFGGRLWVSVARPRHDIWLGHPASGPSGTTDRAV
jgi:tetratricopeptide (TPR) repeat protein